jgi:glucan phosphoethanolaminetransferase (alkaline phosphatase superfamily)
MMRVKMNTSKVAVIANAVLGKIASIAGYTFGIITLLGLIVSIPELSSDDALATIVVLLFMLAISLALILKGSQIKRTIKRFKQYVSLISIQQMTSLDKLAASTSQSVEFVKNDLQKMINKKFFANAVIDLAANEIIIGGKTASSVSVPVQEQTPPQEELATYTCPGCGCLGTKPKGASGSCEFCGSSI